MDLNPSFTFESFVVGASNESAVRAAKTAAARPGATYNPLFLCASPGQGKTHLLMALAQAALRTRPELSARYMTVSEFAEAYDTAVSAGQLDRFSRRLAELDLLLLDDVHRLDGRKEIADELCKLQDRLWTAGKQLVVTGDRAPTEMTELDERLVSRFGSGCVVALGPPDEGLRLAILERAAAALGETFANGVLAAVANKPVTNVRDSLSGLARLVALGASGRALLTPEEARRLLGHERRPASERSDRDTIPVGTTSHESKTPEFERFFQMVRTRISDAAGAWESAGADDVTAADIVRSREKMIWTWPLAEDRLIEELF